MKEIGNRIKNRIKIGRKERKGETKRGREIVINDEEGRIAKEEWRKK